MDRWDLVLLVVAAYVAVRMLLRLMTARRDELLTELRQQVEQQKQLTKAAEGKTRAAKPRKAG